MKTIAIVNRKGGVGKSTACVSLAGALVRVGVKVLLVDFDPQATLTTGLMGAPETDALAPEATGAALFGNRCVDPDSVIVPTRFPGLSLLPGSPALDEFNASRPSEDRLFLLRDFLADVSKRFDRVLIDCPPNLYALSAAAMTAADFLLCPTKADPDGVAAIRYVNAEVERMQAGVNPWLTMLGYVLGDHYKRNAIHLAYAGRLKHDFPALLFDGCIPHASAFVEARNAQTPIAFFKPRIEAAKSVERIMLDMESRMTRTPYSRKEAA